MLHQVGVSFDLYYDARKQKIKIFSSLTVHLNTQKSTLMIQCEVTICVIKTKTKCNFSAHSLLFSRRKIHKSHLFHASRQTNRLRDGPFDKHLHIMKNTVTLCYKVVIRVVNFEPEFSFSVHILGSVLRHQITHKTIHSMQAERKRLAADTQCYENILSSNMQSLLGKSSASICHAVPDLVQRASRIHWPGLGL